MKSENNDKQFKKMAALKYDMEKDNAPRIVAKGKGKVAEKLLKVAAEHDIPIKKDQDIVELLVHLNIGEEIPPELYQVIAEILSFIYRLENED